jgi:hypothetical protein
MATTQVDQAAVMRQNQSRDLARQVAATNYGQPEVQEVPNAIPASNDAALAASIEQFKATDVAYQRAQNQELRDQIEAAYTATQQRLSAAKQVIEDRATLVKEQQIQADISAGDRLALEMQTLTDDFPPNWTPESLPLEKLRRLNELRQQVNNLAAATGAPGLADGVLESGGPLAPANVLKQQAQPQTKHETFPDGQAVHVSQNQDGTMTVEYATGERFTGDPLTVTQKIGEAHVNTKLWARQQRAQPPQPTEPQLNQQPATQSTEQPASGSLADDLAARQADALARRWGYSNEAEFIQDQMSRRQRDDQLAAKVEQFEEQELAARFHATCPDFPDTEDTANTVMQIISSNGWQPNLESLQAAHALAIRNGLYQPLTAEQIQIANGAAPLQQTRQAAPPMLKTNNPEITNAALSPYDMSLGDLRKAAIKQELDRNAPGYR